MKNDIGVIAGKIWHFLSKNNPATVLKIKSVLGISNTLANLALGWLAREDKIEMKKFGHTYEVKLKK